MDSTVLTLQWPEGFDPADVKRFESEARALRYRALGRACRSKGITTLMVAHHADDQAETILMRLANNRLRSGLQGMQNIEWIPECEGMYGVYHSGGHQRPDTGLNIPFPVEKGGIQIVRPLLTFEKSRLIATCEDYGVKWAEDKTNAIPTLTSRNAIRHIYKNHQLPEALSIESLVKTSKHMQHRIAVHKKDVEDLFHKTLIKLDIQTGSLFVRFPPFSALLDSPIDSKSRMNEARNNAYLLLERVAELVSPKPKSPIGKLASAIDNIYPELAEAEERHDVTEDQEAGSVVHVSKDRRWAASLKRSYSVFGVWWRLWDKPSPFPYEPEDDVDPAHPHPRTWLLTRQPLQAGEADDLATQLVFPPSAFAARGERFVGARETYRLFDGRFWIRIHNHTLDTMIIRMFKQTDHHQAPTALSEQNKLIRNNHVRPYRYISAALELLKPYDIRYTIPALFRKDHETGEESLVGFPTLNVRMHGFGPPHGCAWDVRYKKIDPGSHRSMGDIVVPGLSRRDIEAEEKRERIQSTGVLKLKKQARKMVVPQEDANVFTGFKRGTAAAGFASPRMRVDGFKRLDFGQRNGDEKDRKKEQGNETEELSFLNAEEGPGEEDAKQSSAKETQ